MHGFREGTRRDAGKEQINERLFLNYGRLLGHMHILAKAYIPPTRLEALRLGLR